MPFVFSRQIQPIRCQTRVLEPGVLLNISTRRCHSSVGNSIKPACSRSNDSRKSVQARMCVYNWLLFSFDRSDKQVCIQYLSLYLLVIYAVTWSTYMCGVPIYHSSCRLTQRELTGVATLLTPGLVFLFWSRMKHDGGRMVIWMKTSIQENED